MGNRAISGISLRAVTGCTSAIDFIYRRVGQLHYQKMDSLDTVSHQIKRIAVGAPLLMSALDMGHASR